MKLFVLIFSLVIAFVAIYYGIKMLRIYRRISKWTKTNAKVLSKAVAPKKLASGSRARFRIVMEYSYWFNNKEYKNDKVFLVELLNGEKGFLFRQGEKFLQKINSEIEIYVDPNDPARSVAYRDGLFMYLVMIFMGFFSAMIGLLNYIS